MRIAFASDVHVEFYRHDPAWIPPLPDSCDVLVLAGDIDNHKHAIESVQRISDALPATEVIFVAGNHEFYRKSIDRQILRFREAFADHQRIHYLENDSLELEGITFLGCTLWSGFDALGPETVEPCMTEARRGILDFQVIRTDAGSRPFYPMDAAVRYQESRTFLQAALAQSAPEQTVVITHFPPCMEVRHKGILPNLLTGYFQANCLDIIQTFQPAAWIYGHNHWSDDIMLGKTRVVSNQLGYPEERIVIPEYDPEKMLEVHRR